MNAIRGIAASPGIAIGTAVIVAESLSQVSFRQVAPEEVAEERTRLEAALAESRPLYPSDAAADTSS